MVKRYLILEDGTVFEGEGFGAPAVTFGEVVFNTAMTGYQEIITNPIYHNQIVIFTQPNVGNSLIHSNVYESIEPPIKGVIVRHLANITAQKGRHRMTLDQYLNLINVPGITNVDTRALIRKLREIGGAVRGSIVPVPDAHAFDQLHATVLTSQQVAQVATPKPYPNPGSAVPSWWSTLALKTGSCANCRDASVTSPCCPTRRRSIRSCGSIRTGSSCRLGRATRTA